MEKFSADRIYTVSGKIIENGVVITDESGKILSVEESSKHDMGMVRRFEGAIIPGFVNTHCHLELSHMKGMVDTGTGLIDFITAVISKRDVDSSIIEKAIAEGDKKMYDEGIVAVGDISNTTDTFGTKRKSRIKYHTFVEMFDLFQIDNTPSDFDKYKAVFEDLRPKEGDKKTIVPHAPYSVSRSLFEMIGNHNPDKGVTISIHNQETAPEDRLFLLNDGRFKEWYQSFGLETSHIPHTMKPSIYYAMDNLNPNNRTLFVHNTLTQAEEIKAAREWSKNVYWATCPNANLYIENRLPDYRNFINMDARMTIGTDSLTSNWQLSILEEMKTIHQYQSYIPFETILRWATLNGAEALGYEDELGSIEKGKKPGLLLLENFKGQLSPQTTVKRIEIV